TVISDYTGAFTLTTSCLLYIWPYSPWEKRSTRQESMSMPQQLHREGRKHRTAHWHTFRSLLARSLSEREVGCWLRSFRNTGLAIQQQCGLSLAWHDRLRRSG